MILIDTKHGFNKNNPMYLVSIFLNIFKSALPIAITINPIKKKINRMLQTKCVRLYALKVFC